MKRKKTGGKDFVKGQSGNPGGRPKGTIEFSTRCRELSNSDAFSLIESVIKNDSISIETRLKAAFFCIERAYGKANQPLEHSGGLTLEQLIDGSMRAEEKG